MRDTFTFGPLTITRDSRVVMIDENPVKLTDKEHKLILVLAEGRKYMNQAAVLRAMYGNRPDMPEEKEIDVFVCKIRGKFRRVIPVGAQFIGTLPGAGYKLMIPASLAA